MSREGLTSSGVQSASFQLTSMASQLFGMALYGDGTNAATLTIYDSANSTTSGKLVIGQLLLAATEKQASAPDFMNHGIVANNGMYAVLSGTGASCIAYYALGA